MKQSLEKEVLNLQASLDHERSSRNHASEETMELQGLLSMWYGFIDNAPK